MCEQFYVFRTGEVRTERPRADAVHKSVRARVLAPSVSHGSSGDNDGADGDRVMVIMLMGMRVTGGREEERRDAFTDELGDAC